MKLFRQISTVVSRSLRSRGFTQIEIIVIIFIIGVMATLAVPGLSGMFDNAKMKQASTELRSAFQETQRYAITKNVDCISSVVITAHKRQSSKIQGACLSSKEHKLPNGIGIATNIVPENLPTVGSAPKIPAKDRIRVSRAGLGLSSDHFLLATDSDEAVKSDPKSSTEASEEVKSDPKSSTEASEEVKSDPKSSTEASEEVTGGSEELFCHHFGNECLDEDGLPINRDDVKVTIGFDRLGVAKFNLVPRNISSSSSSQSAKFVTFRLNKVDGRKSCLVVSRSLGLTRIGTYQGDLSMSDISDSGRCQAVDWTAQ